MRWTIWMVIAVQSLQTALAARILALCTVASPSHSLWCYRYLALLAERGHQITVFGVDEPKIQIANLTTFIGSEAYEEFYSSLDVTVLGAFSDPEGLRAKIQTAYDMIQWSAIFSRAVMKTKALQDLINRFKNVEKPFDLIIHDNIACEALLGLVPMFGNPPLLFQTAFGFAQWTIFRTGNMFNPAYVPNMFSPVGQHMTFYERCLNILYYVWVEYLYKFYTEPYQDKLMREFFGDHLPPLRDIVRRANVVFANHHFALDEPRPLLPGVIELPGLHISPPSVLPKDIQEFMDGARHGAILLSFGTNVNSRWFPEGFENILVRALKGLPQRVLWKWDRDVTDLPPNIKVSKWLPQGDMLAHPNMRLFVTHCGLLSTQEAVYHKIPLLGLPVFADQIDNAMKLVRRNLTIKLDIHTITSDLLRDSINEILSNPLYKKNVEELGELVKDMPLTAQQQAVFWTEYVIRHDGAPHLRSAAADMLWTQLLLLDVLCFFFMVVFIILWLTKCLLQFSVRKFLFSKPKSKSE